MECWSKYPRGRPNFKILRQKINECLKSCKLPASKSHNIQAMENTLENMISRAGAKSEKSKFRKRYSQMSNFLYRLFAKADSSIVAKNEHFSNPTVNMSYKIAFSELKIGIRINSSAKFSMELANLICWNKLIF